MDFGASELLEKDSRKNACMMENSKIFKMRAEIKNSLDQYLIKHLESGFSLSNHFFDPTEELHSCSGLMIDFFDDYRKHSQNTAKTG